MSVPKGSEVETQAASPGATPSPTPAPCPSGDVPKEGSRDIQGKGKIISVPHDWCKSTDSPVPYKIWAWQSSASNLANSVRQTDCRSHVLGSIVNQCYGDEPGTGGGVKSGTNLAECTPLSASPTVRAEGKPMVRYLDKWWMNHKNTWGCLNNSEDMGKYDAPKLQQIDAKLSPIPSREDDIRSAAQGTKVALDGTNFQGGIPGHTANPAGGAAETGAGAGEGVGIGSKILGVGGRVLGPAGALIGMTKPANPDDDHKILLHQQETVRITRMQASKKKELCELACECLKDRGGAQSYQQCVAQKLRQKYYDPNSGQHPFGGGPQRPYLPLNGPAPEVSWKPSADGGPWQPLLSQNEEGMPSNAFASKGMPRPDVSYFSDGNLTDFAEMKFGDDIPTKMQGDGMYEKVLDSHDLDPSEHLIKLNVEECKCVDGKSTM